MVAKIDTQFRILSSWRKLKDMVISSWKLDGLFRTRFLQCSTQSSLKFTEGLYFLENQISKSTVRPHILNFVSCKQFQLGRLSKVSWRTGIPMALASFASFHNYFSPVVFTNLDLLKLNHKTCATRARLIPDSQDVWPPGSK
jgi:hypothetical protein